MADLLYKDEVYAIIGAAMEGYNELGPGFLEPVYQEAMEMECETRGLGLEPQCEIPIQYKSRRLKKYYIADLVLSGKIIIELKAMNCLTSQEEGQVLNYLKATCLPRGLLINFGSHSKLEWKRLILTPGTHRSNFKYRSIGQEPGSGKQISEISEN